MNLTGSLGPEYNVMLTGLTGNLPLDQFLNIYSAPGSYQKALLDKYGAQRQLVEITPYELINNKDLAQPIDQKRMSYPISYAFNDSDLHDVIKSVHPTYRFNPKRVLLRDLVWLANVQYGAFLLHLARRKNLAIDEQERILNDKDIYGDVQKKLARLCPEILPYIPDEQPHFKTQIDAKTPLNNSHTKTKRIERIISKADEYPPDAYNMGKAGLLRVRDYMRVMFAPDVDSTLTLEQLRAHRNYFYACCITGQFGFDVTRLKDMITDAIRDAKDDASKKKENKEEEQHSEKLATLPWPGAIVNGKQSFELTGNNSKKPLIIKLESLEYHVAPMHRGNAFVKASTAGDREKARDYAKQHNGDTNGSQEKILQIVSILHLYETSLPNLYHDILELPDDPAYDIFQSFMSHQTATQKRKPYNGQEFDFSGMQSIHDLVTDNQTRGKFAQLISPYPGQNRRPALIHQHA